MAAGEVKMESVAADAFFMMRSEIAMSFFGGGVTAPAPASARAPASAPGPAPAAVPAPAPGPAYALADEAGVSVAVVSARCLVGWITCTGTDALELLDEAGETDVVDGADEGGSDVAALNADNVATKSAAIALGSTCRSSGVSRDGLRCDVKREEKEGANEGG